MSLRQFICYKCLAVQAIEQMRKVLVKGMPFNGCKDCKGKTFMDGIYLRSFPRWSEI